MKSMHMNSSLQWIDKSKILERRTMKDTFFFSEVPFSCFQGTHVPEIISTQPCSRYQLLSNNDGHLNQMLVPPLLVSIFLKNSAISQLLFSCPLTQ